MNIQTMRQNRDCADSRFRRLMSVLLVILLGSVLSASAQDSPRAVIEPQSWDFGYLPQKSEVSHLFYLHNAGSAPLTVSKIRAVCSCTSVSGIDEPIAPGDSAAILVTFKTGRYHSRVKKPNYVHTDDPENPAQSMQIVANVVKDDEPTGDIAIEPLRLKWKIVEGRIAPEMDSLAIVNNAENPVTVSVLHAPHSVVNAIDLPVEIAPGNAGKALLHISGEAGLSELKGLSITLSFAGQDTTIITIPIEIED